MAHDGKTEAPTPRRRLKAREQGQVARSRELSGALSMLAALIVIAATCPSWSGSWKSLFRNSLAVAARQELTTNSAILTLAAIQVILWTALPVLAAFGLAVAASIAQGGILFSPEALGFKLSRISPASRFGQLFSLTALSNILKALLPTGAIIYLCAAIFVRELSRFSILSFASINGTVSYILQLLFEIAWKCSLVLLIWSGVDYLLVRFRFEGDIKMSREEIREEMKQTDENPQTKQRIRRIQRQARRTRMLKDVARATVVVTNPTHFAVALEYRLDMAAPIVLAKGRNLLAQKIKEAARWRDVPILENPPLAQTLYRSAEIGQQIPVKLYTAVAEIIAYLYQMQAQKTSAGRKDL
jgi:flagellar biosynthesis protein FlhB